MLNHRFQQFIIPFILVVVSGCGTTTKRLATEQLLISDAVDEAVGDIDFSYLSGQDVFLDASYMRNAKGINFANTDYIISSLRQQIAAAGCRLQDNPNDARIIVEPRVGALGTDGHEVNYGLPATGQITAAASTLASVPLLPALPEISFGRTHEQLGVAKIVVFAYDRESKIALWQSGVSQSESSCRSSWVLGAGPFQKGTIHEGTRFAGRQLGGEVARYDEAQILAAVDPLPEKLPEKTANADADADADAESESATEMR